MVLCLAAPAIASAQTTGERGVLHAEVSLRAGAAHVYAPFEADAVAPTGTVGVLFDPFDALEIGCRWRVAPYLPFNQRDGRWVGDPPARFDVLVTGPELALGLHVPTRSLAPSPYVRGLFGWYVLGRCSVTGESCGLFGLWGGGEVGLLLVAHRDVAVTVGVEMLGFLAAFIEPALLVNGAIGLVLG